LKKEIQIVSFAVPYPANFGGIIDVFHKIRCLQKYGFEITLHCFTYKKFKETTELEKYCKIVYYYKRKTNLLSHLSIRPYIVESRNNTLLLKRLSKQNSPIIFEGLHSCYFLNHPALQSHFKIFRESNVEHQYYLGLAKASNFIFKKLYYWIESKKLDLFEKNLKASNLMLIVSKTETAYFKYKFPNHNIHYLPSFHEFDAISSKSGKGNFILYHGNLGVEENQAAACYLIENVFSKIEKHCIIAGLNPPDFIVNLIKKYSNLELKSNISMNEMNELIENAHINVLYTHQDTGLKLKLLNALFKGRFCLVNEKMIHGTPFKNCVEVAANDGEFIQKINDLFSQSFQLETHRINELNEFQNDFKTQLLINLLKNGN
jgi:hypothetical protein